MAIVTAICNSFKQEVLQGIHQPGDDYKIAVFLSTANLNKTTTAYSTSDETTGTGYTAGGLSLAGYASILDGDVAYLDWSTNPVWANASITGRGCLIYNATRANKAVAVYSFGSDVTSTNGNFSITLPVPSAATALVRLA